MALGSLSALLGLATAAAFLLVATMIFDPASGSLIPGAILMAVVAGLGGGATYATIWWANRLVRPRSISFSFSSAEADHVVYVYSIPAWFYLAVAIACAIIAALLVPYEPANASTGIRQLAYAFIYFAAAPAIGLLLLVGIVPTGRLRTSAARAFGARPVAWFGEEGISIAGFGTIPWENVASASVRTSYTKVGVSVRLTIACREVPASMLAAADPGGKSVSLQLRRATEDALVTNERLREIERRYAKSK
jgi:hypothetical protein